MNRYRVVMRNPKSGQVEVYVSKPATLRELATCLEIFRRSGYTDIDFKPIGGEFDE